MEEINGIEGAASNNDEAASTVQLGDIKVEIIQEGVNTEASSGKRKRKKTKLSPNESSGYRLTEKPTIPKCPVNPDPDKELLENWREALQKSRQVLCPFPECRMSYCSIRGLLLHYRSCTGQRTGEDIIYCKICCNYCSGKISFAHHNRLLHPTATKALNPLEFRSASKRHIHDVQTTKSRRCVRKPARYRENPDNAEDPNKQDEFMQNLSPMTANARHPSNLNANVTRLPCGTYNKEDFPESVLKSSFLYRMGLAPTDKASNVVVLEDEAEDKLPSPKPEDDAVKTSASTDFKMRKKYTEMVNQPKPSTSEVPVSTTSTESIVLPVKRKRGRPRKDSKIRVAEPAPSTSEDRDREESPKRKRRRKNAPKNNETNEFLTITVCGECWEEFRDPVLFDKHVATKHGTQGPLDNEKLLMKEQKAKLQKLMRQNGHLTCPNQHCKKPLLSLTGYLSHIKNCKQDEAAVDNASTVQSSEPTIIITCRECNSTFTKDDEFENHALIKHHGLARVMGDNRPFTEDDRISAQKKMLKQFGSIPCPNCPKSYLSIQGLQYHLKSCKSDSIEDLVCNHCRLLFTNLQTFREHVIAKHNGLALPVGDERVYNLEDKKKILLQVLKVNQKLVCLSDGCSEEFNAIDTYMQHEDSCPKAQSSSKFECGVCKLNYNSQSQFNNHAMIAHNGLARINGASQLFTDVEKGIALKNTLKALKRLHCLRENCGKTFTSLGGYQYHLSICGQESVLVECEFCGKKLKEASMKSHKKTAHPPTPPPPVAKSNSEGDSQVRNAAKRAREKVSEIAKKLNRDDEGNTNPKSESSEESEDSNYELPDADKIYTKPIHRIPTNVWKEWKKQFESKGSAMCTNENCEEEFSKLKDVQRHFVTCMHSTLSLCYTCNTCQAKYRTETQMQLHVGRMHNNNNNSYEGDELDSDNEDGNSSSAAKSAYGQFNFPSFRVSQDLEPLFQAADWTYDFHKRNCENIVFPSLLPYVNNWKLLSESEYTQYLPEETTSIAFQSVDVTKKEKPTSSWARLDRFSCKAQSDTAQNSPCTLFTGGPVWSMAWCPTPPNKVCDQYLAVSCHKGMEDKILMSSVVNKPGLIQIWKIGDVTQPNSSESKFVLGITHNFGTIWNLEWCPSGCSTDVNSNNSVFPRLGLLAAACSNGKICIISVPDPASLPKTKDLPIFQVKPTVVLQTEPVLVMSSNTNVNSDSQCLSMSWLKYKGHSKIAGAFSNGCVALWNISAETPLLRYPPLAQTTTTSEIYFSPYKIFQAHTTHVQDCVWAPFSDGKYLATCGADRQTLIWSIDDINLPTAMHKHGRPIRMAWSSHWCGVFVTQDECYNYWRTHLRFLDTGYFGYGSRCLTTHNGPIWDVSLNDWLNCAVTCDSNGEVIGTVLTQLLYGLSNLKNISKKRFPISRATLHNLKAFESDCASMQTTVAATNDKCESNRKPDETGETVVNASIQSEKTESSDNSTPKRDREKTVETKPDTYKEAIADFGIIFRDVVPTSVKLIPNEESKRLTLANTMTQSDLHMFPITSINRVAWNPNLGSHLLVASGGHSGLVRIHRIHWLQHQANIEKLKVKLQSTEETSEELVEEPNQSDTNVNEVEDILDSGANSENSVHSEANCISTAKSSDIEWLRQANIEKIRTALQAHTVNISQERSDGESVDRLIN